MAQILSQFTNRICKQLHLANKRKFKNTSVFDTTIKQQIADNLGITNA